MATIAAARPLVKVHTVCGEDNAKSILLPSVFTAPIRDDIVRFVHTQMAKNRRQAYAVSRNAGHQHSAESWGTGRAVARIPRVAGGGTHRAGQAAFGNMCRSGRMFAPTKTYRKWHKKINTNEKRYATVSCIAASALPSLVMARGHKIDKIPEVPLVLGNGVEGIDKTKKAIAALKSVNAFSDVEHAANSKKLRVGRGKTRNRRYVMRRGPLVVYNENNGICQAFRNLPGVDLCHVSRLNLLQLAPGGHLGRFIVWTQGAFEQLDKVFGTEKKFSEQKTGYKLPKSIMLNADITRIINSDEVQSKVKTGCAKPARRWTLKKNPLKNKKAMNVINPYSSSMKKAATTAQRKRKDAPTKKINPETKKARRAVQKQIIANLLKED